jgi:hypothetical protein
VKQVALAAAILIGSAGPDREPLPEALAVRAELDAYLEAYEPLLSALMADERLSQRDGPARGARLKGAAPLRTRNIESEVAFVGLPGNAGWLGFRRTVSVNGKRVADTEQTLSDALTDGARDEYRRAQQLLTDSARHNLGAGRTTNLPNLPLELLHRRHRHRFLIRVDGMEKIRGAMTARLMLDEQGSPTLIRSLDGDDLLSLVIAWVEASTGRLHRAEVRIRNPGPNGPPFESVVRVEFTRNASLEMLVPSEMRETFFAGQLREGSGIARYSNFRRFQTSVRLVPQG